MKEMANGITAAKGFRAGGIHCGIKKEKKDLTLVASDFPAIAAGVYTTNSVVAAPVVITRAQIDRSPSIRAIIVNSGNANACTGEQGMADGWTMVNETARVLGFSPSEVVVASTGVIGKYLLIEKIVSGLPDLAASLSADGHAAAAEGIMTTDTFAKEFSETVIIDGVPVTIGGMSKGSGMIAPNMATMLAFVTTDAAISPFALKKATALASERSFNRITVDGDTSTNDMLIVVANGAAENSLIASVESREYKLFYQALERVLIQLAKMIVMDGEGATKFLEITVVNASSEDAAARAARSIANSNLVKTAFNGEDANWGRILAAVGYSGILFNPDDVEIFFGSVPILGKNYSINFSEEEALKVLKRKEIAVKVSLNQGTASATFWTCDLSKEYVAINANYRT